MKKLDKRFEEKLVGLGWISPWHIVPEQLELPPQIPQEFIIDDIPYFFESSMKEVA